MVFDPFAELFSCCILIGLRVIASQEVDLEIWGPAESWDLVPSLFLNTCILLGLVARYEIHMQGVDGSQRPCWRLPVQIAQRQSSGQVLLDQREYASWVMVLDYAGQHSVRGRRRIKGPYP